MGLIEHLGEDKMRRDERTRQDERTRRRHDGDGIDRASEKRQDKIRKNGMRREDKMRG